MVYMPEFTTMCLKPINHVHFYPASFGYGLRFLLFDDSKESQLRVRYPVREQ
jgi:hypothetical protein